jgi:hypothetical protein
MVGRALDCSGHSSAYRCGLDAILQQFASGNRTTRRMRELGLHLVPLGSDSADRRTAAASAPRLTKPSSLRPDTKPPPPREVDAKRQASAKRPRWSKKRQRTAFWYKSLHDFAPRRLRSVRTGRRDCLPRPARRCLRNRSSRQHRIRDARHRARKECAAFGIKVRMVYEQRIWIASRAID